MTHERKFRLRALTVLVVVGVAAASLAAAGAGAQTATAPGVDAKTVKIGYISSQTGVAAPTHKNAHKSCEARVDAQNAKGGVNGRKIEVTAIDDTSSAANLTAAQDLVQNRKVFAVIDNSAFAFLTWRFLKDQGVPMIGGGFDGSYYYNPGNENIISGLGSGTPVPGLTYDTVTRVMKQMGATKVAALGYGASPSSSESAKATETYGADAQGLKGVYLNNTLDFGGTDVGPVVLGIKNAGADGLYLPLDSNTNFAIVQALQQNGVKMKANILATGYSQDLLNQPIAQTIQPTDVMFSAYRPVELGGPAIKTFLADLKKYAGLTGVPDYGTYTGYIVCDMMIKGLQAAGKNPTRQGFVDGVRGLGQYNGAGLTCAPIDLSLASFGKVTKTSCTWFVAVKNGKFVVLNGGKPETGKLVGDPALIAQYTSGATAATTTAPATTAAP
ncbi:MAG: branched-chain amino acid transport system substrate-binding protein [Actinomycetota bacterium]|nr:branched-chain amino acid transport system substrate-binding protein [Actinomycetota bacterium]